MGIENCPDYIEFREALHRSLPSTREEYIQDFNESFEREKVGTKNNLQRLHRIFRYTSNTYHHPLENYDQIDLADKKNKIKAGKVKGYIPGIQIWLGLYDPAIATKWFAKLGLKQFSPPTIPEVANFENKLRKKRQVNTLGLFIPERAEHKFWTSLEIKYSQRNIELVGRGIEREKLYEFMSPDTEGRDFLWWQLAGKAGQGKSLLALHLVEQFHEQGWQAGFVPSCTKLLLRKLETYEFVCDTLIVLDQVSSENKTEIISELINSLIVSDKNKTVSVRLLILDRQPYDEVRNESIDSLGLSAVPSSWQFEVAHPNSNTSSAARRYLFDKDGSLLLEELDYPEIMSIVEQWFEKTSRLRDREVANTTFNKQLRNTANNFFGFDKPKTKNKDRCRPLFAILLAEALLTTKSPSNLKFNDIENLLEFTLDQDAEVMFGSSFGNPRGYGLRAAESNAHLSACFINIVGGCRVGDLWRNGNNKSSDQKMDALKLLGYAVDESALTEDTYLTERAPDLLAEYQVLRLFDHLCNSFKPGFRSKKCNKCIQLLLIDAWERFPVETGNFYLRTFQNFPAHPAQLLLLDASPLQDKNLRPLALTILTRVDELDFNTLTALTSHLDVLAHGACNEDLAVAYFKAVSLWVLQRSQGHNWFGWDYYEALYQEIFHSGSAIEFEAAKILARSMALWHFSQDNNISAAIEFYRNHDVLFTSRIDGLHAKVYSIALASFIKLLLSKSNEQDALFFADQFRDIFVFARCKIVWNVFVTSCGDVMTHFQKLNFDSSRPDERRAHALSVTFNNLSFAIRDRNVGVPQTRFIPIFQDYYRELREGGVSNAINEFEVFVRTGLAKQWAKRDIEAILGST